MHDIWNPWHGCIKCSEGCDHCYMYYLDKLRDKNGADIYKTKTNFNYPLQKTRKKTYKIQSGEQIRICMTSDFFLEEADIWCNDAWDIIRQRPDVKFFILTKRAYRIQQHLPNDWNDGWENVILNVTCENQQRADERIPILLDIPAKHKGIMCAPFIGPISIDKYLATQQIEQVICGGENYDGARPCHFEWVQQLQKECISHNTTFCFIETGTNFVYQGQTYYIPNKQMQSEQAYFSGINYNGKPIHWHLTDINGIEIPKHQLYTPNWKPHCNTCGSKLICNGCSNCGKCKS